MYVYMRVLTNSLTQYSTYMHSSEMLQFYVPSQVSMHATSISRYYQIHTTQRNLNYHRMIVFIIRATILIYGIPNQYVNIRTHSINFTALTFIRQYIYITEVHCATSSCNFQFKESFIVIAIRTIVVSEYRIPLCDRGLDSQVLCSVDFSSSE